MARLLDDIRRNGRFAMPDGIPPSQQGAWDRHCKRMYEILQQPIPLITINNVAEYYYTASDQEYWDINRDFPNLAPPYEVFGMEHLFPTLIHSKDKGDMTLGDLPRGRFGCLFIAVKPEDAEFEIGPPEGTKWILVAEMYFDYGFERGEVQGPVGTWMYAMDEHGVLLDRPMMKTHATAPEVLPMLQAAQGWIHPSLLAISFMHCKNVTVVENTLPPKLVKSIQKKKGQAPTSYKTLVIEPLKEILRREGKSEQHGLQKAMHICRGHFRDYRQGAGLFGKYKQLVWTPSTIRGTKRHEGGPPQREVEIKL